MTSLTPDQRADLRTFWRLDKADPLDVCEVSAGDLKALLAAADEAEREVAAFRKSNDDWRETTGEAIAEQEAAQREALSWEANYATLKTEADNLRRWKDEAMPVMDGLRELGKALDLRPGTRCTGPEALLAVNDLRATNAALSARIAAVEALADQRDVLYPKKFAPTPSQNYVMGWRDMQRSLRAVLAEGPTDQEKEQ